MDYVLQRTPTGVSATGLAHVPGRPENIAYMSMFFADSLIAHVHVNWLAPVKVRRTLLGGSRRMVLFDDLEASEKIKVYDRGISVDPSPQNVYQMLVGYRTGDMQELLDAGIATRRGVMNAHREAAYPPGTWRAAAALTRSEAAQDSALALPLFHDLEEPDQDRVITQLRDAVGRR